MHMKIHKRTHRETTPSGVLSVARRTSNGALQRKMQKQTHRTSRPFAPLRATAWARLAIDYINEPTEWLIGRLIPARRNSENKAIKASRIKEFLSFEPAKTLSRPGMLKASRCRGKISREVSARRSKSAKTNPLSLNLSASTGPNRQKQSHCSIY